MSSSSVISGSDILRRPIHPSPSGKYGVRARGELIIRVLVLPRHNDCCTRPILKWIAENRRLWTRVNLMFQYRSEWRARERSELRQRLSRAQIKEAVMIAEEARLKNLVR